MKPKEKFLTVKLLEAIGIVILLIGLFTSLYDLMHGLITAIVIWVFTGVLKSYYGFDEKPKKRPGRTSRSRTKSRSRRTTSISRRKPKRKSRRR
ncbi:MAG: hypothetical protein ABIE55_01290 [Candidatus Aenigmatarchaeota archaeon]